jgi:hypothetical protein
MVSLARPVRVAANWNKSPKYSGGRRSSTAPSKKWRFASAPSCCGTRGPRVDTVARGCRDQVGHGDGGTLGETPQALIPLVHHAGGGFLETGGVRCMVMKLGHGTAHGVAYLLNERALLGWLNPKLLTHINLERLSGVPALSAANEHAGTVVGVAIVDAD